MKRKRITLATSFFIVSMGLMLITWLAATILAFTPILERFLAHSRLNFSLRTAVDPWLLNDNSVILISGSLIIVGYLFWFIARQLTRSQNWWVSEGCPQCHAHVLTRVRRKQAERLIGGLMKLPLGRYACRQCTWEGLRLVGYKPNREKAAVQSGDSDIGHSSPLPQPAMAITASEILDSTASTQELGVGAIFQTSAATAMPIPGAEIDRAVGRGAAGESWINTLIDYAHRPFFVAMVYLGALTAAEVISVLVMPTVGVTIHIILLFILLVHAAFTWDKSIHRFLLALTLVPLIRVISLSLPLVNFSLSYWFFITSVPLFAAAYMIMRQLNFSWLDLGLRRRSLPLQLAIGSTGFLLGLVEYLILKPDPLIDSLSWQQIWLPAIILLICTGFLEEFIFRFLIQRTSIEQLGRMIGIIYVAIIFAIMHIGYRSVTDFLFVFLVGLFFGFLAWRTRSIVGVTIAHGVTNIMVFLILPFLMLSMGDALSANVKSQSESEAFVIPAEVPAPSATLPDAIKIAPDDSAAVERLYPLVSLQSSQSGSDRGLQKALFSSRNSPIVIKAFGMARATNLAQKLCYFHKDNEGKAQDQGDYGDIKQLTQSHCFVT